jgi:hypothetical protein
VSPVEWAALGADDLLAFSRQRGAGLGRTAWNHLATALSGFYRWLDMSGHGGAHLVGAVPSRRRYRLADVPCALSWEQVRRLLGVVDVREPNGRRNYSVSSRTTKDRTLGDPVDPGATSVLSTSACSAWSRSKKTVVKPNIVVLLSGDRPRVGCHGEVTAHSVRGQSGRTKWRCSSTRGDRACDALRAG